MFKKTPSAHFLYPPPLFEVPLIVVALIVMRPIHLRAVVQLPAACSLACESCCKIPGKILPFVKLLLTGKPKISSFQAKLGCVLLQYYCMIQFVSSSVHLLSDKHKALLLCNFLG